jgi:hypothetical protein
VQQGAVMVQCQDHGGAEAESGSEQVFTQQLVQWNIETQHIRAIEGCTNPLEQNRGMHRISASDMSCQKQPKLFPVSAP